MKITIYSIGFSLICLLAVALDLQALQDNQTLKNTMYLLTAVAMGALAVLLYYKRGLTRDSLSLRPNLLLLSFFGPLVVVQLLWHDLLPDRKTQLFGYVAVAMLTYSVIPYHLNEDKRLLRAWLGVCAVVAAALSITAIASSAGFATFLGLPFSVKERDMYHLFGIYATGGITSHPLTLGTETFFGLCCACYLWQRRPSPLWLTVILLNLSGMALSMSRGAWLATAAASFYWFTPRRFLRYRGVMSVLLPLTAGLVFFGFYQYASESALLSKVLRLNMGMSKRDVLWTFGLQAVAHKPWAGYGFLSSGDLLTASRLAWTLNLNEDAPFHNTFLDMAIYTGVPLAAIYISLYLAPLIGLMATRPRRDPNHDLHSLLLCVCLGGVISSFFLNYNIGGLRLPSITLAVFLGVANWRSTQSRDSLRPQEHPRSSPRAPDSSPVFPVASDGGP